MPLLVLSLLPATWPHHPQSGHPRAESASSLVGAVVSAIDVDHQDEPAVTLDQPPALIVLPPDSPGDTAGATTLVLTA